MSVKRIILLVFIFTLSCGESVDEMKTETQLEQEKDSLLNGRRYWYYEDNMTLKIDAFYKDGVLDGDVVYFYRNGDTSEVNQYENGFFSGNCYTYYESGVLKSEKHYGNYFDSLFNYQNTCKFYDNSGQIIKDSSYYFEFLNPQSEYTLKKSAYLHVKLVTPIHENMYVSVADLDEKFNVVSGEITYIEAENFEVNIPLKTEFSGEHILRFCINDYNYMSEPDSGGNTIISRKTYVSYKYYVN